VICDVVFDFGVTALRLKNPLTGGLHLPEPTLIVIACAVPPAALVFPTLSGEMVMLAKRGAAGTAGGTTAAGVSVTARSVAGMEKAVSAGSGLLN